MWCLFLERERKRGGRRGKKKEIGSETNMAKC